MRAKISANDLLVEHRAGTDNVADLFTKCLGTKDFLRHRTSLGFETFEVQLVTCKESETSCFSTIVWIRSRTLHLWKFVVGRVQL